ncbi:MAG: hypothetical protein ACJ8A6_03540 [Gemmatimonadales bacterium]
MKPGRFDGDIEGYSISAQAAGTDPSTGEDLSCAFTVLQVDTDSNFIGSWADTTTIVFVRARRSPSQQVTYDTTIAAQAVRVTVSDSFHISMEVSGPLTESLAADMIPAYPGWGSGDWTCGTAHPLSRVQPDVVLSGRWQTQPIINIPIE